MWDKIGAAWKLINEKFEEETENASWPATACHDGKRILALWPEWTIYKNDKSACNYLTSCLLVSWKIVFPPTVGTHIFCFVFPTPLQVLIRPTICEYQNLVCFSQYYWSHFLILFANRLELSANATTKTIFFVKWAILILIIFWSSRAFHRSIIFKCCYWNYSGELSLN